MTIGLGGKQGNGKQMFSWISIADVLEIVTYLQTHKDMAGVYNCSSPHLINNKTLLKTFSEVMTTRKIIIAGGTGFVGKYLTEHFTLSGYKVIIISRQKGSIQWHDTKAIKGAIEDSEMLINLAGKSVDCRYNEKNKEEILKSRTETTKALGEAILQCSNPPELWINSSTATIYRHAEDRPMTESKGEIGTGFSVSVAKSWEQSFFDFQLPKTRQVALRMAIVLGKRRVNFACGDRFVSRVIINHKKDKLKKLRL